ncbi:MAG: TRAP transporter small permease subunit [Saprospiraceae bacterium]|nr:TRAP transporter small permease subunit [Saprospiraceae bacterium]
MANRSIGDADLRGRSFSLSFRTTAAWVIELEWHIFAIIFLLGGAYAFKHDRHVRVDLFYTHFSEREKAWLNLLGSLLLLIPWCIVTIFYSTKYALLSYQIQETSSDPGGLPALYVLKFIIVIGFILVLLQGMASIFAVSLY